MTATPPICRTLSEIRSTCQKAARGAGCPWGLAEEAGLAARVLESHGLPGAAALATVLGTPRACQCNGRDPLVACGLASLATLSDSLFTTDPIRYRLPGRTVGPLLLIAPLLLAAIRTGRAYAIGWSGARLLCGPDGLAIEVPPDDWCAQAEDIEVATVPAPAIAADALHRPKWSACEVPPVAWHALEQLAARTMVPESRDSRAAGAGPDASDVD